MRDWPSWSDCGGMRDGRREGRGNGRLFCFNLKYMNGATSPAKITKPQEYPLWENSYAEKFAPVNKAITAKALPAFEKAYNALIAECNACYAGIVGYGFIRLVKQKFPSDVGIDFALSSKAEDVPPQDSVTRAARVRIGEEVHGCRRGPRTQYPVGCPGTAAAAGNLSRASWGRRPLPFALTRRATLDINSKNIWHALTFSRVFASHVMLLDLIPGPWSGDVGLSRNI